ncbi:MAG: cbb3-type cytochrome c oxidase subunit I [Calditrichia bacterium]
MFEFTKRTNSASLAFFIAGSFWFMVGTVYGLFSAIHLVAPEFFNNIPFLVFGRVRPTHVNTVAYGFVVNTLIGCGIYFTPALLRTRLWSEPLGWISFLFWNLTVLSGPLTFAFGWTQGREYSEYVWLADFSLLIAVVTLTVNGIMTVITRREKILYVSVWYFIGTFIWVAGAYPLGNVMWHPASGAMPGLLDSVFLWMWGHNLPGLLLTPLATGVAYFVLPRVTKTPLYSHTLSLVGFWTLVALYSHIGGHHIIQAPIPAWLKTISIVDSMLMTIPVFVVLINLFLTIRGRGGAVLGDPGARLVVIGLVWYLLTCIQGPMQSLPVIQRVTHFNNWTIGHSHIAVLGFAGFIALGGMWHVLPLVTGRRVFSKGLVNMQFGLLMLGLSGFFVVLTIAGLIQGEAWNHGEVVYRVLPMIKDYMIARAAFGIAIITAAFIGFYNLMATIWFGEKIILSGRREVAG